MNKLLSLILAVVCGVGLLKSDTVASVTPKAVSPTVLTDVHTRRESGVERAASGHYEVKCFGTYCKKVWVPDQPTLASGQPPKITHAAPAPARQRSIVVRRCSRRGCR